MNKFEDIGYPIFISPKEKEYTCIGYAVDYRRTGWEWFAFENEDDNMYFGYVQGFVDEFGYFSVNELTETGIEFFKERTTLHSILPPVGWTKKRTAGETPCE